MWRAPCLDELPASKLGGILCLLIGVGTLLLLRSRHKNLPFIHLTIYVGLVHDEICLMLYNRLSPRVGDILKMWGWIWLWLCPRSLILRMPPPLGFTLHNFWRKFIIWNVKISEFSNGKQIRVSFTSKWASHTMHKAQHANKNWKSVANEWCPSKWMKILIVLHILMTHGSNDSRFKKLLFGDDHDMLEELEELFKYKIASLMVKFVVVWNFLLFQSFQNCNFCYHILCTFFSSHFYLKVSKYSCDYKFLCGFCF